MVDDDFWTRFLARTTQAPMPLDLAAETDLDDESGYIPPAPIDEEMEESYRLALAWARKK